MPDIQIDRAHTLGLPEARRIAGLWAQKAEAKFDMQCRYVPADAVQPDGTPAPDVLHFQRPGIEGTMQVTADRFALQAELGFLFSAFKDRITAEIEDQFDRLLAPRAA